MLEPPVAAFLREAVEVDELVEVGFVVELPQVGDELDELDPQTGLVVLEDEPQSLEEDEDEVDGLGDELDPQLLDGFGAGAGVDEPKPDDPLRLLEDEVLGVDAGVECDEGEEPNPELPVRAEEPDELGVDDREEGDEEPNPELPVRDGEEELDEPEDEGRDDEDEEEPNPELPWRDCASTEPIIDAVKTAHNTNLKNRCM